MTTVATHRALPDMIYEEVRARIVSGRLEPGQPVRQDHLAAELGVSKIPLREALARLESVAARLENLTKTHMPN